MFIFNSFNCLVSQMNNSKLFYKYQRIDDNDCNHTIDNLSKNQLYFNDPTKFNDPFDCKVNYILRGKEKDWVDWMARAGIENPVTDGKLNLNYEFIEKDGDIITFDPENKNYRVQNELHLHGDIHRVNLPRVCCFSKTEDNILMWSHYADNHQGICLRFRSKQISDGYHLTLSSNFKSIICQFEEIKYRDILPPEVNMLDRNRHEFIVKFLLTKYSDWKYEKEYRMFLPEDKLEEGIIRYEKESLEGIIFGLKMNSDNIKRIYDTIDDNYLKEGMDIIFYESKEIRGSYNIKTEKINDIDKYLESLE